ncbi:ionotropic receptor 93a-like [Panulirus ornatus]|uniref:ionotropic receptor 93a-like n=1 Tax=Panulirus ornatus TaxID=150431 RepID=UPI003A8B1D54
MGINVALLVLLLTDGVSCLFVHASIEDVSGCVGAVLEATSDPSCSLILLTDGNSSASTILKEVSSERSSPRGVTVMEVRVDGQDGNVTQALLYHLVGQARQVRLGSWCVSVVVVSYDPDFLTAFAESSHKGRLLVWATRLLVVTSLTLPQLHALLPTHWTFSMMNTIFLNLEEKKPSLRVSVYTYLPYSPDGSQVVRVASWMSGRGYLMFTRQQMFPEKFKDFKGETIPVSVLPFPPFWVEEDQQAADGTTVRSYSGTDGEMFLSLARALNFTFHVLPANDWVEVEMLVKKRISFVSPVMCLVLPQYFEHFDMTYTYNFVFLVFSMRKPGLSPSWQSLYYPLANQVWLAILTLLLLVPIILTMVVHVGGRRDGGSSVGAGSVVQDLAGMLLGQNLPRRLPTTSSSRLLVAAWLVFAFIIGTVYRGNLTAHLTLPKYPPRPETVEELIEVVDKIPQPPYAAQYRDFLMKSENNAYRKLGELMSIGSSIIEGLQQTLEQKQAVVNIRAYLEYVIAETFTSSDGSTDLYIGRESIMPSMIAWLIPHDAPYRPQFDRCMRILMEAGLYGKWNNEEMLKTRLKNSRRQQEYLAQQQQQQGTGGGTQSGISMTALTLTHMQGPLILLLLGLALAGFTFTVEVFKRSVISI